MNINNFGGTIHYNDHHKEFTINGATSNIPEIVRSFFAEDVEPVKEDAGTIPPDFFRVTERFSEANIRERLAAELTQATSKIDFCRALYRLQHIGCINIDQYASDAQRAKVLNSFQSKYDLSASDFCRARMNR